MKKSFLLIKKLSNLVFAIIFIFAIASCTNDPEADPLNVPIEIQPVSSNCKGETFTFSWVYNEKYTYEIEYSNDNFNNSNSVSLEGVEEGKVEVIINEKGTYKWRIRAYTEATMRSMWIESDEFEVISLEAPTLKAVSPNPDDDGYVVFNWDNEGQDIDSTVIQISKDAGENWQDYTTINGTATSYDNKAENGKIISKGTIYWRVRIGKRLML